MPSNIADAERMVNLFTSVGARDFVVTKTDVEQKLIWGKTYTAAELREKLRLMMRTAEIRRDHKLPDGRTIMAGENLIVRPIGPDMVFVQLDDLTAERLDRVRPAAFIIHATSPGNHQAWIAVSDVPKMRSKEFVRRVRKAVGDADMSASGSTRIAGSENWKIKNLREPPVVTIIHGIPGRVMTAEHLEQLGLLAEAEPVYAPRRVSSFLTARTWPDYARCLHGAPPNHAGDAPDISRADFFWCMMAAQRNHTVEEIAGRLMELSPKAKENGEQYARITAENATAAARSGRRRA